ncbi:MAG: archaeosortase A, partial [Euryarchaeota archaeon]|nr:archaeosortase A [Euryarchaeota archaeon]
GMKAPRRRQMLAFAIVIPGIYLLNLVRNLYVILAYAYNWYGPAEESFYIAHTVYAKIGSTLALLLMAAITFKLLPEVVDFIEETGYAVMGRQRKPRAGGGSP